MYELEAGPFYRAVTNLSELGAWIAGISAGTDTPLDDRPTTERLFHKDAKIEEEDKVFVRGRLNGIEAHLRTLSADITILSIEDARKSIDFSYATWETAQHQLSEVSNTLRREISQRKMLVLDTREQALYSPKKPHIGPEFDVAFATNGVFELDEAAKCLALGRSTASVFHLMRLMEIGIRAAARCLGIPDPIKDADRNWGRVLDKIKGELDGRVASKSVRRWTNAKDKELFARVYASLDAVRVAWRNPTMHVENKYTPDEAEHIFLTVRGFMKTLAERCDEEGQPAA
jgi:hypothetical protein